MKKTWLVPYWFLRGAATGVFSLYSVFAYDNLLKGV